MEKYEIYIFGASNWWTLNKGFSEANTQIYLGILQFSPGKRLSLGQNTLKLKI